MLSGWVYMLSETKASRIPSTSMPIPTWQKTHSRISCWVLTMPQLSECGPGGDATWEGISCSAFLVSIFRFTTCLIAGGRAWAAAGHAQRPVPMQVTALCSSLQLPAVPGSSLQLTAVHCSSLQFTAVHCSSVWPNLPMRCC